MVAGGLWAAWPRRRRSSRVPADRPGEVPEPVVPESVLVGEP